MDIKKILFKTNEIDVEKALPDAVIYCNKDGKIQWVNDKAAEIFETSKMHLLTSNIVDFIENGISLLKASLKSEKAIITKMVGKEVYYDMTSNEVEDGYVLAFRDISTSTGSVITEEELEEQEINRNKNTFLLKLSNDFKSPLQSIVGFSQAMSDGLGGNMSIQQEKYIKIIRKNSTELMYFITKLLDFSQSETDIKTPEYKTFDIANLISSVVKYNEQLYKDKDVKWNIEIENGFKNAVVTDESYLRIILQNIIEVILKSVDLGDICISVNNPSEDCITAKSLPNGEYIMITVSSSSLLLSENDLESMFDPYKIIDTSNRKNLLRAMILACVKNLVQSLNGIVWVESQILKNTNFNVIIPLGK